MTKFYAKHFLHNRMDSPACFEYPGGLKYRDILPSAARRSILLAEEKKENLMKDTNGES